MADGVINGAGSPRVTDSHAAMDSFAFDFYCVLKTVMIPRDRALALLSECTGETIWPVDLCQRKQIPSEWIDELSDAFESSFDHDRDTIYFDEKKTNQFHGVRDVDLAAKLGLVLGIDVGRIQQTSLGRSALVAAIKEAVMDG